jgi:hypothetical protein
MVLINNAQLAALSANDKLCKDFPMFAHLRNQLISPKVRSGGCGTCGNSRNVSYPDYNSVKVALSGMSQSDKDKFKQITGFDKVKIVFANGSSTQTVIF